VKGRTGRAIVEAAHMELASPSLAEAYAACVAQGATRVVCHPFFLSPGRHVIEDIPAILEEAARRFPDVPYVLTAPLGASDLVPTLIAEAVEATLRSNPAEAAVNAMGGFFGEIMRMTQAMESENTADSEGTTDWDSSSSSSSSSSSAAETAPTVDKAPLTSEELAAKPPPSF
jgi:sirohydrochlorin ferrochelatase